MTLRLSYQQVADLEPCSLNRIPAFDKRKTMTAAQALAAGVPIDDLLWVAGQLGLKEQCVRFALGCARRAEHLSTDPRVKAANDAAQAWLDNPCEETRLAADRAAGAADRAGDALAAWAAWAAAWAAAALATDAALAADRAADRAAAGTAARAARTAWAAGLSAAPGAQVAAARVGAITAEILAQRELFLQIFG